MTVKEARGKEREDKGIEDVVALRAVAFNLFQFADIQTLVEGSRRALCREVTNNLLAFHSCLCHTLVLVT